MSIITIFRLRSSAVSAASSPCNFRFCFCFCFCCCLSFQLFVEISLLLLMPSYCNSCYYCCCHRAATNATMSAATAKDIAAGAASITQSNKFVMICAAYETERLFSLVSYPKHLTPISCHCIRQAYGCET